MLAFGALADWSSWVTSAADLAASGISDLDSGPSWQPALRTLARVFADGQAGTTTAQLISRHAAAGAATSNGTGTADQETDAGSQRDRPSRQRLAAVVNQLISLNAKTRMQRQRGPDVLCGSPRR
jgi:hypothetical protein